MQVIHKHITKEMLKYIGGVMATVIGIYLAVEFFERIDNFMESGIPVARIFPYLIFKAPFIASQTLPVCILLSVLITFGLMVKNNEIIALKSSGISVYALVIPVIAIGIISSFLLFFFAEIVVPITSAKSNKIWWQEVKKRAAVVSKEKNIWLKENRLIIYIKYYNKSEQTLFGITLYHFDEKFRLAKRIDAKEGRWTGKEWMLQGLMIQTIIENGEDYQVDFKDGQAVKINLTPENLETVVKKSEEMGFQELRGYVKKVEDEGYDATLYKVDLYAKVSFPFICLIISVIGMGIALRGTKSRGKEGLPVSVALGIGTAFLFWIFYSFCLSLGYGGMLPPMMAAWVPCFVFSCFAGFLLLNVE